jgi:hypothetical protein
MGAPRIHGEFVQLGFDISEPAVSRYLQTLRRNHNDDNARSWQAFLNNHQEVFAAFDFFTVPTFTFSILYCFFVIEHDRRRILHFNVTAHPTAEWIVQQLCEALPFHVAFDICCLIATPNSVATCESFSRQATSNRFGRAFGVHGRTESQSVGSAVLAAICSTTSFPLMNSTCGGLAANISLITTTTEPTSVWGRRHQQDDLLSRGQTERPVLWLCPESAVSITAIPGLQRLDR